MDIEKFAESIYHRSENINDMEPVTDSLKIAEIFGKKHCDIRRDIRKITATDPDLRNSALEAEYLDTYKRVQKKYNLAKKITTFLISRYRYGARNRPLELQFLETLKMFVPNTEIKTQHHVGGYRVDFYLPEHNIAIEYDEDYHKHQKSKDVKRQKEIAQKLGCKFIRVKQGAEGRGLRQLVILLGHSEFILN